MGPASPTTYNPEFLIVYGNDANASQGIVKINATSATLGEIMAGNELDVTTTGVTTLAGREYQAPVINFKASSLVGAGSIGANSPPRSTRTAPSATSP